MVRTAILISIFFVFFFARLHGQTSFKDNRWFDEKRYSDFYSNPIREEAEIVISSDSIIAHLGSKTTRYAIKSVKEIPKSSKTEYAVENNGNATTIYIRKTGEQFLGRPRTVAWIASREEGWIVLVPLKNINPQGWLFAGDPKIDIEAERVKIPGYYVFATMKSGSKEDIKKDKMATTNWSIKMNDCQQDLQVELLPDNTGTWWYGQNAKDCKKSAETLKWKLTEEIVNSERVMILSLFADGDANQYTVVELTKGKMVLKGEFNLGMDIDTTTTGFLELTKSKKK